MKAGYFSVWINYSASFEEKRRHLGYNTGNVVFIDAIFKMFDCDVVSVHHREQLANYDIFLTNDLIWLQEGAQPWGELLAQLSLIGDRALVPLSVGLQADSFKSDFYLHPDMVAFLKAVSERVPIPTRGTYTAEILGRHGIGNVQVMGCPSLYQLPLYPGALEGLAQYNNGDLFAAANFGTFGQALTPAERDFLLYLPDHFGGFIDQTFEVLPKVAAIDDRLALWMKRNIHAFFDLESWVRHDRRYDFSMGARFHGNVVPMLNGTRSLFLAIDSRTRELTDYLRLPTMEMAQFDASRPLRHYYDRADYTDFLGHYPALIGGLVAYAEKWGLPFSPAYHDALTPLSA